MWDDVLSSGNKFDINVKKVFVKVKQALCTNIWYIIYLLNLPNNVKTVLWDLCLRKEISSHFYTKIIVKVFFNSKLYTLFMVISCTEGRNE
jgi:hypothetical protein